MAGCGIGWGMTLADLMRYRGYPSMIGPFQLTGRLRWAVRSTFEAPGVPGPDVRVLQQEWYDPSTKLLDWRDVPESDDE
jgi:hypothetical protein